MTLYFHDNLKKNNYFFITLIINHFQKTIAPNTPVAKPLLKYSFAKNHFSMLTFSILQFYFHYIFLIPVNLVDLLNIYKYIYICILVFKIVLNIK